ncbi:hypothetical protein DLAC_11831 [Tieghemostelium lacteum]|uniref:Uncharacterized protein n=1 Tax=Tieghemostelium lacteum TaxID=361077 RepID=A0A151Z2M7_TIELA|nr:hypothetical protein DLAC_11831 [Tieghemostelium lacteum]|eukprot:KYQ88216.1 hypothetical protein DLAC_11831 [Tieghemostelium lacteum]
MEENIRPSFIIKNLSNSAASENQNRLLEMEKMVIWIECGSESGIIVDSNSRIVDIYCSSKFLEPQFGQPNLFVNRLVQEQKIENEHKIVELKNKLHELKQSILVTPEGTKEHQNLLYNIETKQDQLNILDGSNIHFENMTVVPNHPAVCHLSIPFWEQNPQKQPQFGPNMKIHCIGEVNGFILNLAWYPM